MFLSLQNLGKFLQPLQSVAEILLEVITRFDEGFCSQMEVLAKVSSKGLVCLW